MQTMKIQNSETIELAAIAAAVAGKCQPCFAYHFKQAQKLGIPDEQIREIIQLAKDIRASGDKHMDEFAERRQTGTGETTS
jgi:AhpD family alkylhydroperoxidase